MPDSRSISFGPELHATRGGPTDPAHDERLRRGIIDTNVKPSTAFALVVAFLLAIYAVPLSQVVMERLEHEPSSLRGLVTRTPTSEHLRDFEKELEEASYPKNYVQPRVQLWLSRFGRAGNQRAVIGHDGWLYYTPGITHLAGPSFLDTAAQREREQAASDDDATQPLRADPLPAIFEFADLLGQRGIRLVLFPVPDKAMVQPYALHGRGSAQPSAVARNLGWRSFVERLRAHGVLLFDPTPARISRSDAPRFLVQDTHWTPRWMESVADQLARFVERSVQLPKPAAALTQRRVSQHIERVGDLVDMLKLPEDQKLFRAQRVTVHQVQDGEGELWASDPDADVLLLGDSFTNVFTLDRMEWGEAAGLGPQLSFALGRAVDVIAQNDSGAFATRQALMRRLARGADRLAGKRVVIWEFASRELSVGDWKLFDAEKGEPR